MTESEQRSSCASMTSCSKLRICERRKASCRQAAPDAVPPSDVTLSPFFRIQGSVCFWRAFRLKHSLQMTAHAVNAAYVADFCLRLTAIGPRQVYSHIRACTMAWVPS